MQIFKLTLKNILVIYFVYFKFLTFSQAISNKCELDGKILYSDCIKYIGECEDGKANGYGELNFENGNTVQGLFSDNKIQNFNIVCYFPDSKSYWSQKTIIGPNKGLLFHGPCVSISDKYIDVADFYNGSYTGNSDSYFQISKPNFDLNTTFCDPDGYSVKDRINSNLIPNTNLIIYTSSREYNNEGAKKYWISVVEISTNKIIRTFGNYINEIIPHDEPIFVGFNKDNNPIYKGYFSNKIFQLDIISGKITQLKTLPIEISTKNDFTKKIKETKYKDLEFRMLEKFKILKDSSYIKLFSHKKYIENIKEDFGSGSSIVMFDKHDRVINSVDLFMQDIYDFDVDENNDRIALLYGDRDSTFLKYLDLKTFKIISNVFNRKRILQTNDELYGKLKFSKTGTYLLYEIPSGTGTLIYLGNKLHYAIPGNIYDLNNEENVAISNKQGIITAYDLEKKTIIWNFDITDNFINTKFFKIDDKIFLISGRALSWDGYKVKENGIKLYSFKMPKPLFSLVEFSLKPEEVITEYTQKKETKNFDNKKSIEYTSPKINKSEDEIMSNYLALMFLAAIFESSNKYSSSNHKSRTSQQKPSNTWQCRYCGSVAYQMDQPLAYFGGNCYHYNDPSRSGAHAWENVEKDVQWQCSKCTQVAHTIEEPCCGYGGKCYDNKGRVGGHSWRTSK